MSKSSLLLFAATLSVFGMAILTGHPPWGAVTGVSILLTAAAMATGALGAKALPEEQAPVPRASSQKIPASLVTLSATAILAVYAAGYQRTRDAADSFEAQTARHQSAPVSAVVVPPKPLEPAAVAPLAVQPPSAPQRSTAGAGRPSADAVPKAPAQPTAASEPPATAATTPAPEPTTPNEPTAEAAASAVAKPQIAFKDGTFLGWGRCRHGSIQASVAIQGGQIVSTEIAQCLTRYSCSWIANLPGQIVTRQSANVDYVSGATESTDAFYDAVSSALALARE